MAMESLMLVCKYGHEAVPIENTCSSFEELVGKIRSKWVNLRNEQFTLTYSTPGTDKILLRDNEEFTCMLKMASIFSLRYLEIKVSAPYINMDTLLQNVDKDSDSFMIVEKDIACISTCLSNQLSSIEQSGDDTPLLSAYWGFGLKQIGQVFRGGRFEFRAALIKYAIDRGFDFRFKKNDSRFVKAFCKSKPKTDCPWYVRASLCRSTGSFIIREFVNIHTCRARLEKEESKRLSSKVVAGLMKKPLIGKKKSWDSNDVADHLKKLYGHDITYKTAYNALSKARTELFGDEEDSYRQLLWYTRAANDINPGSKIVLELANTDNNFHRIFVAWAACIEGFRFIRPMLFLDGTFLKGKYKGCLLAATGKNANQELYPIAYAVVDAENGDNWLWFLKCLREVVGYDRPITFISDRCPGLLAALAEVFPESANFFCNRHLKDNLKGRYNGNVGKGSKERIVTLFDACAYASSPADFAPCLAQFVEGGKIVENFLKELPYNKWTNSYSGGHRYDEMTSNAIESFNSWIRDVRGLPITQCIDKLRKKLMEWFDQRRKIAAKWNGYLCKVIEDKLEKLIQEGRTWWVKNANSHVFEVLSDKTYTIDLMKQTCTCHQWRLKGFPCSHAVAAVRSANLSLEDYIQSYWFVDSYQGSYENSIMPISTSIRNQYEFSDDIIIKPPELTKKQPGRPKQQRFKTKGEREDVKTIKCSRCKKFGRHNKKSCRASIHE